MPNYPVIRKKLPETTITVRHFDGNGDIVGGSPLGAPFPYQPLNVYI